MKLVMVLGYSYYPLVAFQDPTSGNSSRLPLSSKSLTGVLEDVDVLDGAGDGVRVLIISSRSFTESFIKIQH